MSPLFQDELHVVLSPEKVLIARTMQASTRPGLRRGAGTFGMADCAESDPAKPAWAAALAALEQELRTDRGAALWVVLSDLFITYSIVPWRAGLHDTKGLVEYVHDHFVRVFGDLTEGLVINVSGGPEGHARLACAVEERLLVALRDLCARRGVRLMTVQPQLSSTFNRYRDSIAAPAGWIVVVESECMCVGLFDNSEWISVRAMRTMEDWQRRLATLLERERYLADSQCETNQVFIWGPDHAADALLERGRFRIHRLVAPAALGSDDWYDARFGT